MIRIKQAVLLLTLFCTLHYKVRGEEGQTQSLAALDSCQGDTASVREELAATLSRLDEATSEAAEAKAALADSQSKVSSLEHELEEAKQGSSKATALETEVAALKASLDKASAQANALQQKADTAGALERELSKLKAALKGIDAEAADLRVRAEEAEERLLELQSHHASEWLPHWLERTMSAATTRAGPMLMQTKDAATSAAERGATMAQTVWKTHGAPLAVKGKAVLWDAYERGYATVDHKLRASGIKLPDSVTNAYETARSTIAQFIESEIVLSVRTRGQAGLQLFARHAHIVVSEIEDGMVGILAPYPAVAPLKKKPASTWAVYAMLGAPLVAFVMPVLARRRSSRAAAARKQRNKNRGGRAVLSSAASGDSHKTPVQRRRKQRISVGGESVYVPS